MAVYLPISLPATIFTRLASRNRILAGSSGNHLAPFRRQIQCTAVPKISDQTITRRSANYKPPIWRYDYIQSLESKYVGESCSNRLEELKENVRLMFDAPVDPLDQLELIDILQRLGVYYHFEDEIKRTLNTIYNNNRRSYEQKQESLYAVALEFRLLRQQGYDIPTEIFNSFRDEKGSFESCLDGDCKAALSLYEAAFLLKEGEESIFHDARDFTTKYLREYIKNNEDQYLSTLVNHALELPLYWRVLRLEARWFIDVYERRQDMNPVLLEFAKLDFNVVQATHQEDLKHASRWWNSTALGEKLSFARDRVMENFLWTVGVIFEPQFGYCRRMCTEVNALITTIDDVYDVYGTLDELQLFTEAVDRWDISAMEQLPYYMKMCFLVLVNSINKMALDALKEQEVDIINPHLKKAWADICKSYLLEAKWFSSGYIPTIGEYMENAWISISAPVILVHAFHFITNCVTNETLGSLEQYNNIIRCSSTILRLADDLGTASDELKRGDVAKSIQCYMHETGVSEEEAREYIREMIAKTWMKMNKDRLDNPQMSKTFVGIGMNLARMSQCMYQYGDGHGTEERETKDRVLSLLVDPIQK